MRHRTALASVVALQLGEVRFLHCEGNRSKTARAEGIKCSTVVHPAVERRGGGLIRLMDGWVLLPYEFFELSDAFPAPTHVNTHLRGICVTL